MTLKQEIRWKAEAELIQELGKIPSSREMQKLLKDKYNIIVNHNIVNTDLKKDLESLTKEEFKNQKDGILSMLNIEIDIAHNIALRSTDNELQLKAMNTVTKLSKTKSDILIKFRQAQSKLTIEERPVYNISIGQPKKALLKNLKNFKKIDDKNAKETT